MISFDALLNSGCAIAAMSGVAEGDCSLRPEGLPQRKKFLARLGAEPDRAVGVLQVHGNRVLLAAECDAGRGGLDRATALGEANGIATNSAGLPICISVADCFPVLLFSPSPRAGAVLHSGREGTYTNIAAGGVRTLESLGCNAHTILAVVGPGICARRYEVSDEITKRFREAGYPVEGRHLDLGGIIRQQLLASGLSEENIFLTDVCTFENPQFYSFRRDGNPMRNLAVLML